MANARRVYLYGLTFIALWLFVFGLTSVLTVVASATLEVVLAGASSTLVENRRQQLSLGLALAVVGAIAWAVHWWLAQRLTSGDREAPRERVSALRQLMLNATIVVGGLALAIAGHDVIRDAIRLAIGQLTITRVISGDLLNPIARLLVVAPILAYYVTMQRRDQAQVPDRPVGPTLRRWRLYILSGVGVLVLAGMTVEFARLLAEYVVFPRPGTSSSSFLGNLMAGAVAGMVVGAALWLGPWLASGRDVGRPGAAGPEAHSVLRRVYLYLLITLAVLVTLASFGDALHLALTTVLKGAEPSMFGARLMTSLATALVFLAVWRYHANVLHREAMIVPVTSQNTRAANLPRLLGWLYSYLVALGGLLSAAAGAAQTLSLLVNLVAVPGSRGDVWQDQLSLGVTLIVIGAPVWVYEWLRLSREIADPMARNTIARRLYLYIVMAATVLTLIWRGVTTLYETLRFALGEPWSNRHTADLAEALAYGAVAAVVLAYHLMVFRRDAEFARSSAAEPATPSAPETGPNEAVTLTLTIKANSKADLAAFRARLDALAAPGVIVTDDSATNPPSLAPANHAEVRSNDPGPATAASVS